MEKLVALLENFWEWTGLDQEKWNKVDFNDAGVDPVDYPLLGEMCQICMGLINKELSSDEMNHFLTALAIDNEDEDVLYACKTRGTDDFLYRMALCGITHRQSDARWQIAELLHLPIRDRNRLLKILLSDSHAYVRKRAENTLWDLNNRP